MYLTAQQVQDELQISKYQLSKLIELGDMKAVKVSGQWRIKRDWIHEYIELELKRQAGQTERSRHAHVA